jgi:hypothetical protein
MTPPNILKRNEYGLIEGVEYKFDSQGFISWREMIDPKFLYPNKDWFEREKLPVPESIEGLEDNQLLIQLGGIKELARLRGYVSVEHSSTTINREYVTDKCGILWKGNYETDGEDILFEDVANASVDNCSGFGSNFLETIAANRSFVRAVRNFLNIHIVGADEISKSKKRPETHEDAGETTEKKNPLPNLNEKVKKALLENGYKDQASFRTLLEDIKGQNKIEIDIPNLEDETGKLKTDKLNKQQCRVILDKISKK